MDQYGQPINKEMNKDQEHLEINQQKEVFREEEQQEKRETMHKQDVTYAKNTVFEEDAPIKYNRGANGLSAEEREQKSTWLKNIHPGNIRQMKFDELANWAKTSVQVDSANEEFQEINNQMIEMEGLSKEIEQEQANNRHVNHLLIDLMDHYIVLTDAAKQYIKSHKVWYKAWRNKGKCRLALAERIVYNANEMVRDLNLVAEGGGDLSPSFSTDSLKVEKNLVMVSRNTLETGEKIRNSKSEKEKHLFEKFTEDIGGNYQRSQFLDIVQGTYDEHGYYYSQKNIDEAEAALDQYYNGKNKLPLFQLMDKKADELLNFKIDKECFNPKKFLEDPNWVFYTNKVISSWSVNMFSTAYQMGQEYNDYLIHVKKDPEKAKRLEKKTNVIAMFGIKISQALEAYYGLRVNTIGANARTPFYWEDCTENSEYFTYLSENNYGAREDILYYKSNQYHFKDQNHYYKEMVDYCKKINCMDMIG